MGRPTDREEVKSEIINLRVTPSLKMRLEGHAKNNGRARAAEIEERLLRSIEHTEARTPATDRLIAAIDCHIAELETATGERWDESLKTWAAVAGMLATGPIIARAPAEASKGDDELLKLYQRQFEIEAERREIIKRLEFIGANSLLLTVAPAVGGRDELRDYIDRLGGSADQLQRNYREIDRLEELDAEERQNQERQNAIVAPILDALNEARSLYSKARSGLALGAALARFEIENRHSTLERILATAPTRPLPPQISTPRGIFGAGAPRHESAGVLPSFKPEQEKE